MDDDTPGGGVARVPGARRVVDASVDENDVEGSIDGNEADGNDVDRNQVDRNDDDPLADEAFDALLDSRAAGTTGGRK
jgi:hypothetical protein